MGCQTVLVVDDDDDIREALAEALAAYGYEVVTAGNGREAFEVLSRIPPPCLILLDLMMPVMSGQEFLSAARADASVAGIPVIIVSASHDHAARLAAQGLLRKPINLGDLLDVAERFCGPI